MRSVRDVKLAPDTDSVAVKNIRMLEHSVPLSVPDTHGTPIYARYDALNDYENCGRALLTGPVWPLRTRDTADEYHEIQ